MTSPGDPKGPPQSGSAAFAGEAGSTCQEAAWERCGACSPDADWRLIDLVLSGVLGPASMLIVAEFLDLYRVQRGAIVVREQTGGDHHSYALLVAGAAAIAAVLVARSTGAWPPAAAAATMGLLALFVVLFGDLPDANSSGLTADARIAEAEPAAGLWVELAGAVLTTTAGAALAILLRIRAAGAEG